MLSKSIFFFSSAFVIFLQGLLALKITSPDEYTKWSLKKAHTIHWTSVSTDPSTFNIVLVNNNANCATTGWSQLIKRDVSTANHQFTIGPLRSVKACSGYQINLVAENNGILAQSAPFKIIY